MLFEHQVEVVRRERQGKQVSNKEKKSESSQITPFIYMHFFYCCLMRTLKGKKKKKKERVRRHKEDLSISNFHLLDR